MLDKQRNTWNEFIAGDQQAMLAIYEQHYLGLINFGIKISGNRSIANECITEMLLGLWNKREQLPKVDNVRSYLLTCLKRTIYHHFKTEKLRLVKEVQFQNGASDELTIDDYFSRIQSNTILKKRLIRVMEKLSPKERELIQLKFFADLDYDEIAQKCNITKRTAYNIINTGLKKMRAELTNGRNDIDHHLLVEFLVLTLFFMGTSTCFSNFMKLVS